MHELLQQALTTLRGMWQWRWIGLGVAWAVGIVAALVIWYMPDRYEASARVWVDTQSVLKPLMSGLAVQPNIDQQLDILSRTLINRPNVEKLTTMADLDHAVTSKEERERLIDRMVKTLQIKGAGRDNLYTLSYRDEQPERAKRVVQSLASIFVESSLGNKRRDSDAARQFIEEQIKIYEAKLSEAENRLKDFKLRNLDINSAEGKNAFVRMGEVEMAVSQARLALREAENSRDAIKRQLAGEQPTLSSPGALLSSARIAVPEIDGRLEAQKRNLDTLLQGYTEQHPDVIGTKRVIAELEGQRKQEIAARMAAAAAKGQDIQMPTISSENPVYQKLKVSLAEAEAQVASLQTRVNEYETRHTRFKASMKVLPQLEAEFTQLNRDYEVHKKQYETLVSRRESAAISGQMDVTTSIAEFRLIDPPRVSPRPIAPNRPLLLTLALLGSLAAGVFAAIVVHQIRPAFPDEVSLRQAVGFPVIGAVSFVLNETMRRNERRSLAGFITAALVLTGAYGAAIAFLLVTTGGAGTA
jgi:polysaccharide chain length determinant protein (PEP-CTERM system associated)